MKDKLRFRAWAGPVTIGSFVVVAATGLLMFFHLNFGLIKVAHEWLSVLFVIGALAHIVLNWKPLLAYLRKPLGVTIVAVFLVLGAVSFVPLGGVGGGRPPIGAMVQAMQRCPLNVAARLAGKPEAALIEQLEAAGVHVGGSDQTLEQIASANNVSPFVVMGQVFQGMAGGPGEGHPSH